MDDLPNTPLLQIRLTLGLPEQECCQQVESGDPSTLLSTGEVMPGLLCPVFAPPAEQRDGHNGESPAKGHKGD